MPISAWNDVAEYVFPEGKFTMEADGEHVADFDVQRTPWGFLVAATAKEKTTWSAYRNYSAEDYLVIAAAQEILGDGSREVYRCDTLPEGAACLPAYLTPGQHWTMLVMGTAIYQPVQGRPEIGTFVYKNSVWAVREVNDTDAVVYGAIRRADLLYWLEDYVETFDQGKTQTQYLRLHCFERGKGKIWYIDHDWLGGTKLVTRKGWTP